MANKFKFYLIGAGLILSAFCAKADIDETSGLNKDKGWEIVRAHCGACHSLQLVTSNSGDRAAWLDTIRWMQSTQKLWQFDTQTEDTILTYLAKNYPAAAPTRRKPIPDHLLP